MKNRAQAEKKFKQGKDYITTGIFNWSKDYSSAATSFDEAFKLFKQAEAYDQCVKCLKQLIICNDKIKDMWAIARNQEALIDIYINGHVKIDDKQLIDLTQQAFVQFRLADSTDNGLKLAGSVAKYLISKGERNLGLDLLKLCYQQSLDDQKTFGKDKAFDTLVSVMLQNEMIEGVIQMFKDKIQRQKQTNKCIDQVALTYICLLILNRDMKIAHDENMNLMGQIPSYLSSSECQAASNLIQFYNQGNVAKFTKQTTRAVVSSIFPVIIVKKLRAFKLPVITAPTQSDKSAGPSVKTQEKQLIKDLFY